MEKFSYYKPPIKNITPERAITLKEVARIIRTNKGLEKIITKLRTTRNEEIKKTDLPCVTFSGVFKKRGAEHLIKHSGLLCVDVDKQQVAGEMGIAPALMFVSPTGTGQKIVFEIDLKSGKHLDYFFALEAYFKKEHNITIDAACKDVSRGCWLSHDPKAVMSDSPTILGKAFLHKYKRTDTPEEALIPGTRNNTLFEEALEASRQGKKKADVLKEFSQYAADDFPMTEIQKIVNNAYQYKPDKIAYVRVGTDYFKTITKTDRYGIVRRELKPWNKQTIIEDHKRKFLAYIPKYDDFAMRPSNTNYEPIVDRCYNLYAPFNHTPAPGDTTWSMRVMEHVFGDQLEQGLRYMQILYLYPEYSTVILVLVSKETETGKTTFCNWLHMLFGQNVAQLSSADFASGFNSSYATKNILVIEETFLEKKLVNEKLKALVTAKQIQVNEKFVTAYKIPFYGKVVLASNNVDRFAMVDPKETRYFVRKLSKPNHKKNKIEDALLQEIPAFLHYLHTLPPVDWSRGRSGFTWEEITNENLRDVKYESRTGLYKDMVETITDYFYNNDEEVLQVTPIDIKREWYAADSRINKPYITKVLKDEFELTPSDNSIRYTPFADISMGSRTGRPYTFKRQDFISEEAEKEIKTATTLPF